MIYLLIFNRNRNLVPHTYPHHLNHKYQSTYLNAFLQNPTFACQLSIAPIIIVGISIYNALILSFAMLCVTIPTLLIACLFGKKLSHPFSSIFFLFFSALFYIPTNLIIKLLFPDIFEALGIYLPMIVINSIIISRSTEFAIKNKFFPVLLDGFFYISFFTLEVSIISFIRELFGKSSFFNLKLNLPFSLPALLLPFSGFILIGLFAASLQALYLNFFKNHRPHKSK